MKNDMKKFSTMLDMKNVDKVQSIYFCKNSEKF